MAMLASICRRRGLRWSSTCAGAAAAAFALLALLALALEPVSAQPPTFAQLQGDWIGVSCYVAPDSANSGVDNIPNFLLRVLTEMDGSVGMTLQTILALKPTMSVDTDNPYIFGEQTSSTSCDLVFESDATVSLTCLSGLPFLIRMSPTGRTMYWSRISSTSPAPNSFAFDGDNALYTLAFVRLDRYNELVNDMSEKAPATLPSFGGAWLGPQRLRLLPELGGGNTALPTAPTTTWFWDIDMDTRWALGLSVFTKPDSSEYGRIGQWMPYEGNFTLTTETRSNGATVALFAFVRMGVYQDDQWNEREMVGTLKLLDGGNRLDLQLMPSLSSGEGPLSTADAVEVFTELNGQSELRGPPDMIDDETTRNFISAYLVRRAPPVDARINGTSWVGVVLPSLDSTAVCGLSPGTGDISVAARAVNFTFHATGELTVVGSDQTLAANSSWRLLTPGLGYIRDGFEDMWAMTYRLTDNNQHGEFLIARPPTDNVVDGGSWSELYLDHPTYFDLNIVSTHYSAQRVDAVPQSFIRQPRFVPPAQRTDALDRLDGTWYGSLPFINASTAMCARGMRIYLDFAPPSTLTITTYPDPASRNQSLPAAAAAALFPGWVTNNLAFGAKQTSGSASGYFTAPMELTDRGALAARYARQSDGTLQLLFGLFRNTTAPQFSEVESGGDLFLLKFYYAPTQNPASFPDPVRPILSLTPLQPDGSTGGGGNGQPTVQLAYNGTRLADGSVLALQNAAWAVSADDVAISEVATHRAYNNTLAGGIGIELAFDTYLAATQLTTNTNQTLQVDRGSVKISLQLQGAIAVPFTFCQRLDAPIRERVSRGLVANGTSYEAVYRLEGEGDIYIVVHALLAALVDNSHLGSVSVDASANGTLCYQLPPFSTSLSYDPDISVLVSDEVPGSGGGGDDTRDHKKSSNGLSSGAVAGIVIGVLAGACCLAVLVAIVVVAVAGAVYLSMRRRAQLKVLSRKLAAGSRKRTTAEDGEELRRAV